ncbi:MAG: hypothetical protein FWC36_09180 [Spirochaetes bacterium]|nr:hypothetical protein [Spirochaetota bacterium]
MADVKEFERFYTRDGFNKSLNHFNVVLDAIGEIQDYNNLADILNGFLEEDKIAQHQLLPIINSLLVDKFSYSYKAINIKNTITNFDKIAAEVSKWSGIDIVLGYHNPNIGFLVLNTKKKESLATCGELKKYELLTIYAGDFSGSNNKYAESVIQEFIKLLEDKKAKVPQQVLSGKYKVKPTVLKKENKEIKAKKAQDKKTAKNVRAAAASKSAAKHAEPETQQSEMPTTGGGAVKMTPLYAVPVTNELFHNGNVEAWKIIINSYKTSYSGCDVIIFYDGERILDINTLFKWGKVKHGSAIMFAVSGKDIKDVAKLQRYLRQGASSRFEDFLKFPVNVVPKLF